MIPSTTVSLSSISSDLSPLLAKINLSALAHNVAEIRRCIPPSCDILAVVKADAYGHGAATISHALVDLGIRRFGVATVQEGCTLRSHGITQPILVMGGLLPTQLPELIHHHLTPVISNEEIAHQLGELLDSHLSPYSVHMKIDTGMRRLGFSIDSVMPQLSSEPFLSKLHLEGVMTHLADADNAVPDFTQKQLDHFTLIVKQLRHSGYSQFLSHAANSAGIMQHPSSHFDMVRPGLMLYGYPSASEQTSKIALHPVMTIATKIVQIRKVGAGEVVGYNGSYRTTRASKIAVLPIGYAHGYSRSLSNRGIVLIQGQEAPIVGKVCMDMTLVDVTEIPHVRLGEEVIILGRQGQKTISAEDIAEWLGTISYEVLCHLGIRAHHLYESLRDDSLP